MNKFRVNSCFQMIGIPSTKASYYRVVWKNERADLAWVIEIPKFGSNYCKAPVVTALSELVLLEKNCELVFAEVATVPIWDESDESIRERYSRKDGVCRLLDARDMRWNWIEELVCRHSLADVFEGRLITAWVASKAQETGKSKAKIYNAIYSYFAGGCRKNALFYNWFNSGAKGQAREQKSKLGRTDAEAIANPAVGRGYHLSMLDKQKIHFAWTRFLVGKSVRSAFREMSGVFYRSGEKTVDGKRVPVLLPARQRPTLRQFIYWGPRNDPTLSAWRVKLGARKWWNDFRALPGSAKDGLVGVGQLAYCDSSPNDVHLVSIASRLKPVGTLHRLLIHEAKSEIIIGLHCSFEAPSARTFLMAVANAASSKVEFYARFGHVITDDEAPALAVKRYLGDNGEYRNQLSIKALSQFGSGIEYIRSGGSSSNGPVEGLHHSLHARVDHTLDGTTHGRRRRRGEPNPILSACMNYYEYMHELLKEVLYYNTQELVPHLLTLEMRRDDVNPTRIGIFRWLINKGYIVDFTPDVSTLRAHLFPALPAVLDETGIYLLREDRSNKVERIRGLRYMADYLVTSGLLENARRNGVKRVTVRGVPEDPSRMWLMTERGLVELRCVADPLLILQGTVRDCIAIQDDDLLKRLQMRDKVDQVRVDIEVAREQQVKHARKNRQAELDASTKRLSKGDLVNGIEDNRRAEMQLLKEEGKSPVNQVSDAVPSAEGEIDGITSIHISPAEQAMQRFLDQRRQP